jgi:hypothetical protein
MDSPNPVHIALVLSPKSSHMLDSQNVCAFLCSFWAVANHHEYILEHCGPKFLKCKKATKEAYPKPFLGERAAPILLTV